MLKTYRLLLQLMNRSEHRLAGILLGLVVISSFLETVGVASILPFLQVISNPEMIQENRILRFAYEIGGFTTTRGFSLFAGGCVFVLILLSLSAKTVTMYVLTRFGAMRAYNLSLRLLRLYLHQPYSWFLGRHSSVLSTTVLGEVQTVVSGCLMPALQLLPGVMTATMIMGFLIWVEPVIGVGAILLLGGGYGVIYVVTRGVMLRLGKIRMTQNRARFRVVNEATGGIKELKIMQLEQGFSRRFADAAYAIARTQSKSMVIRQVPRYALEGLAFGGMILMLLYLIARGADNITSVVPTLGLVVVAFGRLFPALQQIFAQVASLRFNTEVLDHLHSELNSHSMPPAGVMAAARDAKPLGLNDGLRLEKVGFAYPSGDKPALRELDLEIPARSTIGIVGGTGAGKTTLIDIILGLLAPETGRLMVDDQEITETTLPAWQKSIGYVPQQIFLTDGSVAANIAFGLAPKDVDMAAVERAARIAALHDFVMEELPEGYDTMIGEKGVRLSGGQRQRIGIARALYHNPDVLILDEATSALDNLTERAVMQALDNIAGAKTIVMIAHRLSTVKRCDRIFLMRHGQVEAAGTYDELVETSSEFREMAKAS